MSDRNSGLIWGIAAGAAAIGALAAIQRVGRRYDFQDKVVLITGGSRGLGLVMAREFAQQGALLAICARDGDELKRAAADLYEHGAEEVFDAICDIQDQSQVERTIADVRARFGRIDALVNNAGIIQVGPLEVQTQKDFEDAMQVHFWGPYYAMKAVLPEMRHRQEGRIINIISIGGKIPVPHLAPYCASKFALSGLSSTMHTELAKDNILVTSVYPGLMRTGSHINAYFKGQNEKEYAMFSIMNGLPTNSVSAERAARQIIDASRRGDSECVISLPAKLAAKVHGLFPEFTTELMAFTNRFLPGKGGIGKAMATGKESTSAAAPSVLTTLSDAASYRNNELNPDETIH
jgi:NAD(P)-dependent dehydrogenase (short-subunit alcohol dehydrogenase family)